MIFQRLCKFLSKQVPQLAADAVDGAEPSRPALLLFLVVEVVCEVGFDPAVRCFVLVSGENLGNALQRHAGEIQSGPSLVRIAASKQQDLGALGGDDRHHERSGASRDFPRQGDGGRGHTAGGSDGFDQLEQFLASRSQAVEGDCFCIAGGSVNFGLFVAYRRAQIFEFEPLARRPRCGLQLERRCQHPRAAFVCQLNCAVDIAPFCGAVGRVCKHRSGLRNEA